MENLNRCVWRRRGLALPPLFCLIAVLLSPGNRVSGEAAPPSAGTNAATTAKPGDTPDLEWADKVKAFFERDYLLGDWGGMRSELAKRGVEFEFFYAGAVPSNLTGGLKRGSVYEGALLMTLDLDSRL